MNFKLNQAQYARIYGVTDRSVRSYQKRELPLDEPGKMSAFLSLQKTPPPGLKSPDEARLLYDREAGIPSAPTPARLARLEELIWEFWHSHNAIVKFMRENNLPAHDEVCAVISDTSHKVQEMRALAGIVDPPPESGEEDDD